MQITLGEAARQIGVAKGTISKAIKTGKLSATRREDGSWSIDNAELARYLDVNGHRFRPTTGASEQPETAPKTDSITDELIGDLRAVIADLRNDRDHWRAIAERLALAAPPPPKTPVERPKQSMWRWLRTQAG